MPYAGNNATGNNKQDSKDEQGDERKSSQADSLESTFSNIAIALNIYFAL